MAIFKGVKKGTQKEVSVELSPVYSFTSVARALDRAITMNRILAVKDIDDKERVINPAEYASLQLTEKNHAS